MGRSLLDDLEGVDRRELVAASRRRKFTRNEVLFHESDPGDTLHLVTKGFVAIRTGTPRSTGATRHGVCVPRMAAETPLHDRGGKIVLDLILPGRC